MNDFEVVKTLAWDQGPMLWFYNIFAEKFGEKWRFSLKLQLAFEKNLIVTLGFEKNANFFAENWQNRRKLWS
jgi:hypothetical protein